MSFLDGKPRIATESDVNARWLSGRPGEYFRCAFCGYKFQVGDRWRCQYTNSTPGASGNPLVCEKCDATTEALIEKWKRMHEEARTTFWWFSARN